MDCYRISDGLVASEKLPQMGVEPARESWSESELIGGKPIQKCCLVSSFEGLVLTGHRQRFAAIGQVFDLSQRELRNIASRGMDQRSMGGANFNRFLE